MMEKREKVVSSIANIYKLDGRVPLSKAIPFGLQHILAMFVAQAAPSNPIAGNIDFPKINK